MTKEIAQKIFMEEITKANKAGIPLSSVGLREYLSFDKSTRALGHCIKYTYSNFCYIVISEFTLSLEEDDIRQVIAHELCHCVASDNHGPNWKYFASLLCKAYGYNITRLADIETTQKFREACGNFRQSSKEYIIECPCCHHQYKYARLCKAVKHPGMYQCAKCRVPIIRVK